MNISTQGYVQVLAFNSFGYIPRSGITGSYSNSVFGFLRSHQIIFHSISISFHSHQHKGSNFSTSLLTLVTFQVFCFVFCLFVFITDVLMSVKQYHIVVLICNSLLTLTIFSCAYWPFVYLLWRNIQVLCPFLSCIFVVVAFRSSLYIVDINPLSNT